MQVDEGFCDLTRRNLEHFRAAKHQFSQVHDSIIAVLAVQPFPAMSAVPAV